MAGTRVTMNSPGAENVLKSAGVRAELVRRAEPAVRFAVNEATRFKVTGNYLRSIGLVVDEHGDRLVVHVRASAPHAHLVEAKHGVLARALDEFGGA